MKLTADRVRDALDNQSEFNSEHEREAISRDLTFLKDRLDALRSRGGDFLGIEFAQPVIALMNRFDVATAKA